MVGGGPSAPLAAEGSSARDWWANPTGADSKGKEDVPPPVVAAVSVGPGATPAGTPAARPHPPRSGRSGRAGTTGAPRKEALPTPVRPCPSVLRGADDARPPSVGCGAAPSRQAVLPRGPGAPARDRPPATSSARC